MISKSDLELPAENKPKVVVPRANQSNYLNGVFCANLLLLIFAVFLEIYTILNLRNLVLASLLIYLFISQIIEGISTFSIIYISVILHKNNKVEQDLISYSEAEETFIFVDVNKKIIKIPKDGKFRLRDNKRNIGELLLITDRGKNNLGLTSIKIKEIAKRISDIKGYDCSSEIK